MAYEFPHQNASEKDSLVHIVKMGSHHSSTIFNDLLRLKKRYLEWNAAGGRKEHF